MKPGPRILWQFVVAMAVFALFNAALFTTAERTMLMRRLRRMDVEVPRAGIVGLGSSVMEADLDQEVFAQAWRGPKPVLAVNAGIGGTTAVERYLMARYCAFRAKPGTVFVLGFIVAELFDNRLSPPATHPWWNLKGNQALGFHTEPEVAARWHTGGAVWERAAFRIMAHIPVLAERASTWGRIERFRRVLGEIGVPPVRASHFGRARDFAIGRADEGVVFAGQCRAALADGELIDDVTRQLLTELRQQGFPIVLVSMPLSAELRQTFYQHQVWAEYLERLRTEAAEKFQAAFIDAAEWVPEGDLHWFDTTHLAPPGAALFSARLATELAAIPAIRGRAAAAAPP